MSNVKRAPLEKIQEEVDRNYEAFKKMKFNPADKGKYVLLKDAKKITILDDRLKARLKGEENYPDGLYSFQEIAPLAVNLGILSYALRSDKGNE